MAIWHKDSRSHSRHNLTADAAWLLQLILLLLLLLHKQRAVCLLWLLCVLSVNCQFNLISCPGI